MKAENYKNPANTTQSSDEFKCLKRQENFLKQMENKIAGSEKI